MRYPPRSRAQHVFTIAILLLSGAAASGLGLLSHDLLGLAAFMMLVVLCVLAFPWEHPQSR